MEKYIVTYSGWYINKDSYYGWELSAKFTAFPTRLYARIMKTRYFNKIIQHAYKDFTITLKDFSIINRISN